MFLKKLVACWTTSDCLLFSFANNVESQCICAAIIYLTGVNNIQFDTVNGTSHVDIYNLKYRLYLIFILAPSFASLYCVFKSYKLDQKLTKEGEQQRHRLKVDDDGWWWWTGGARRLWFYFQLGQLGLHFYYN